MNKWTNESLIAFIMVVFMALTILTIIAWGTILMTSYQYDGETTCEEIVDTIQLKKIDSSEIINEIF